MSGEDKAMQPEDVTRLVAERLNAASTSPRQFLPGHMRHTRTHKAGQARALP
jgi:hypothetical protein